MYKRQVWHSVETEEPPSPSGRVQPLPSFVFDGTSFDADHNSLGNAPAPENGLRGHSEKPRRGIPPCVFSVPLFEILRLPTRYKVPVRFYGSIQLAQRCSLGFVFQVATRHHQVKEAHGEEEEGVYRLESEPRDCRSRRRLFKLTTT